MTPSPGASEGGGRGVRPPLPGQQDHHGQRRRGTHWCKQGQEQFSLLVSTFSLPPYPYSLLPASCSLLPAPCSHLPAPLFTSAFCLLPSYSPFPFFFFPSSFSLLRFPFPRFPSPFFPFTFFSPCSLFPVPCSSCQIPSRWPARCWTLWTAFQPWSIIWLAWTSRPGWPQPSYFRTWRGWTSRPGWLLPSYFRLWREWVWKTGLQGGLNYSDWLWVCIHETILSQTGWGPAYWYLSSSLYFINHADILIKVWLGHCPRHHVSTNKLCLINHNLHFIYFSKRVSIYIYL